MISTQVRWGFEGLAVNEFEGLEFKPFTQIGRPSLKTGADALARLSFEDSTIRRTAVAQGAILGACYLQTYRVLNSLSACPLVGCLGGAPNGAYK